VALYVLRAVVINIEGNNVSHCGCIFFSSCLPKQTYIFIENVFNLPHMKDNFSSQSDKYAKYRPTYPPAFFSYLDEFLEKKDCAWDCGTGNGQVAYELAKSFKKIMATDISKQQIVNAAKADNIFYSIQPAEQTHFEDDLFDFIVVAQAVHWFDFEKFYAEVKRTAKKDALLCIVGYGIISVSPAVDALISDFYTNTIGSFWDKERRYIDEGYRTIPFPFEEISTPQFENRHLWSLDHLVGYLNTWSAVKHFVRRKGYNPVEELKEKLKTYWQANERKEVVFPILLRIGKLNEG